MTISFSKIKTWLIRIQKARWVRFLSSGLIIFIALFGILSLIFPLPTLKPYSIVIEDRNGQFLHAFLAKDNIWRLRTPPNEIPPKLKQILIRKEDRFFYWHFGVNPFAVVRAIVQNTGSAKRVSGASTITMQVARMLERKDRTYLNKLIEMFRAFQLEVKYSKDEILELYLSLLPLGGNLEGLKSASLFYYQTPLERLNIAELLDLILIPNNPNALRPDRNPIALYQERLKQATLLMSTGIFSREDSLIIWQSTEIAKRKELPKHVPHLSQRIKEHSDNQLSNQSEIITSIDSRIQTIVEALVQSHLRNWKPKGVQNGAVLVIDNQTHEVLAYVGSDNFHDNLSNGQVDVVRALRSPGSTLKPFLFALQMEKGDLTPKTKLLDVPFDNEGFTAENYDGSYSGFVSAEDALRRSLNIPMIHLLRRTGFDSFINFLLSIGFQSINLQKEKLGISTILGGCSVTLEELTTAYSVFPSGGKLIQPTYLKRSALDKLNEIEVLSASSAFMVTEILSGINRPDLPNNFESAMNLPKVAFKTGTSYGRRDAWCIGYSKEFTIGVWTGNSSGKGSSELVGSKTAAPLLIEIFNSISSPDQKIIVQKPADVRQRMVCAKSGLLPTSFCSQTIVDWYSVSKSLSRECDLDKEFWISLDSTTHYCPSCIGANSYKSIAMTDYPAELLNFWSSKQIAFTKIPPHNPKCTRVFNGEGPKILSPQNDMTYFIISPKQQLVLQAASNSDVSEHVWYVDDRFHARRKSGEKFFLTLQSGVHKIGCMDNKGRLSSVKIVVKDAM